MQLQKTSDILFEFMEWLTKGPLHFLTPEDIEELISDFLIYKQLTMDYQKILDTTGTYTLDEHLMALRAGYKCSRLSDDLLENLNELTYNRSAEAQRLITQLIEQCPKGAKVGDEDVIDDLLHIVRTDRVLNNTPHTWENLGDEFDDDDMDFV